MSGATGVDVTTAAAGTVAEPAIDAKPIAKRGAPAWIGARPHRTRQLPDVTPIPERRAHAWVRPYQYKLAAIDIVAATTAALVAHLAQLPQTHKGVVSNYSMLAVLILPALWIATLAAVDAYDSRILAVGSEEFQRAVRALVIICAAVGFVSYAGRLHVARGYVVLALPLAAALTMVGRYLLRKQLHRARTRGESLASVVAVGDAESVADMAERMHAERYLGMRVVGACVPRAQLADAGALARLAKANVPPLGDLDSVVTAVSRAQADSVAVTASHVMSPNRLRELSWQMERINADLVVAPGLVEVAGPRLHIRPVTGLPLLHIEKPEFTGARRVIKGAVDRAVAAFGLLLISPLLLSLWVIVRLTSAGPAFFHQTRVGKDGAEFRIWKFRSMYVDAEARKAALAEQNENGDGLLFKMRNDPRVTPVGRIIRRLSLDELPQLFNVLNGTMSLVGPRPPLPEEVARYGSDVRRRLLVRPGVTGLWQVSGRSDLSWEESVRLDLRYVENWSLGQDMMILWKTASAVLRGSGAY
jgi:exopolysaccharide biosynthesis polyprenyl glycosylphosphotransferase